MPSIAQPTDTDFEITFADLAHAQLRDKAPALLDHLLGFQVIESNEDQTHGVGVLGFKVGEQMLFVPSFFLNGELKQNLIYIKNQDLFVPLEDDWVTYLLNRRPFVMGETEPRKENELGVLPPNMASLSNTIGGTGAAASQLFGTRSSHWQPWTTGIESMFTRLGDRYAKLATLPQFLQKTADLGTSIVLLKTMRDDLNFGNTVLGFHNLKSLMHKPAVWIGGKHFSAAAMRAINERKKNKSKKSAAIPPVFRSPILHDFAELSKSSSDKVSIYNKIPFNVFLPDDDLKKLARGELVFKDARANSNQAYRSGESIKLQNPNESGYYQLLLSPGKYVDALIIIGPKPIGQGYSRVALVVNMETKDFGYWWVEDLWIKPLEDTKNLESSQANKLPSINSVEINKIYTIIDADKQSGKISQGTLAFMVKTKVTGEDGNTELYVQPYIKDPGLKPSGLPEDTNDEDVTQFGKGPRLPFIGDTHSNSSRVSEEDTAHDTPSGIEFKHLNHISITKERRGICIVGSTLFVPDSAKVISLKEGDGLNTWASSDPASLLDVEAELLKAGAQPLQLLLKNSGIYVNNTGPFDRVPLIIALVKKAGLRGDQAVSMVDNLKLDNRTRFLIKNNIGYAPPFPEPAMGYDDYSGVMEQYPQSDFMDVPMGVGEDLSGYLGKPERQQMMEAAQTGQQEVFDTSAIASLVRTFDSSDLITQYLSDIILGLDRVNRILFMYYWRNEQFRDRYGQENLGELEDQLKNVSKSLGKLVLVLKQRQVEGSPVFDQMEVGLGVR